MISNKSISEKHGESMTLKNDGILVNYSYRKKIHLEKYLNLTLYMKINSRYTVDLNVKVNQ